MALSERANVGHLFPNEVNSRNFYRNGRENQILKSIKNEEGRCSVSGMENDNFALLFFLDLDFN